MYFLTINDFIGEVNLDLSNDSNVQAHFEAMATQVENDILRDLLNDKLYNDLIADLSGGVPVSAKFLQLVNGTSYVTDYGETVIYDGLKRMLKYFVYAFYMDNQWSFNSSVGQMTAKNENSDLVSRSDLRKIRKLAHNKAIKLYNKAIIFIYDNWETYFSSTDFAFWHPIKKLPIGEIFSMTVGNKYFKYRTSEEN